MLATPSQCPCIAECIKNFKQQSLHCRIQKAGPLNGEREKRMKKSNNYFSKNEA
jgi:hypothetical protein